MLNQLFLSLKPVPLVVGSVLVFWPCQLQEVAHSSCPVDKEYPYEEADCTLFLLVRCLFSLITAYIQE